MAKLEMHSVFDTKVGAFAPPFVARSRGEAIRLFTDWCRDERMPFKSHPGDYRLFCVGVFDDADGSVSRVDTPVPVIGADELG